jgi:SAM-dependent MidA family methyltransferase
MAEDTVDVDTIFEEIDASPYANSMEEFWTAPVCDAPQKLDSKVPMIFNTADKVIDAENFPQAVKEYLLEVKKDSTTWLKIINSKSSDGYTFLDYMQYNIAKGNYSLQSTIGAAHRVVQYLCQNGGIYCKYKDTVKCP